MVWLNTLWFPVISTIQAFAIEWLYSFYIQVWTDPKQFVFFLEEVVVALRDFLYAIQKKVDTDIVYVVYIYVEVPQKPFICEQNKISLIRETLNFSTDADSRTYTILKKLPD